MSTFRESLSSRHELKNAWRILTTYHAAYGWPMRVKPMLMSAVPWPVWKRAIYPVWLRWYRRWESSGVWRGRGYDLGERCRWRGVRLVCCRSHYCGDQADHPWDPGHGWSVQDAAALWEPLAGCDRRLLALIGDPRSASGEER